MGLHEFAQDDAALKARLDAAVDRLTEELDGIYDRETIRGVVEESARELSGKSVTPLSVLPSMSTPRARTRLATSRWAGASVLSQFRPR